MFLSTDSPKHIKTSRGETRSELKRKNQPSNNHKPKNNYSTLFEENILTTEETKREAKEENKAKGYTYFNRLFN